ARSRRRRTRRAGSGALGGRFAARRSSRAGFAAARPRSVSQAQGRPARGRAVRGMSGPLSAGLECRRGPAQARDVETRTTVLAVGGKAAMKRLGRLVEMGRGRGRAAAPAGPIQIVAAILGLIALVVVAM